MNQKHLVAKPWTKRHHAVFWVRHHNSGTLNIFQAVAIHARNQTCCTFQKNRKQKPCIDQISQFPIVSMGLVYLPTFGRFVLVTVGKYTSPMDPMGFNFSSLSNFDVSVSIAFSWAVWILLRTVQRNEISTVAISWKLPLAWTKCRKPAPCRYLQPSDAFDCTRRLMT